MHQQLTDTKVHSRSDEQSLLSVPLFPPDILDSCISLTLL